jgi:two-component system alkaline phosphatase synthesis response regulator PhoP
MNPKKILIVDDDPDFVLAVRMVLEGEGYQVEEAGNGADALAKMHADLPDLVLMDVMMASPLDGYHTTQEIADDPQLRHVPIVMVSVIEETKYASSFPTDQHLPIVDFLAKPIEPTRLVTKVKGWLKP